MKLLLKLSAAALALLLLSAVALGVQTWFFKPLRFEWFLERIVAQHALHDPELLTSLRVLEPLGIRMHNRRLTDVSLRRQQDQAETAREQLQTLHAYDRDALSPQRRISYDVVDWYLQMQVEGQKWMYHDYPVNPLFGVQSELPTFLATQHVVGDERDARHYLKRLSLFDEKFQQVLEGLRLREERGIVPPRFAVAKVLEQMRGFVQVPAERNLLYTSFAEKLARVAQLDDDQRGELLARAKERIETVVYPAYDQLIAYFERLQKKAAADQGVWALPEGDAYYAYAVRQNTTTEMTPEEVHLLGLAEVARIEAEMDAILRSQNYTEGSVGQRMAALGEEPRFLYGDDDAGRAQCIADFQKIIDEIGSGLAPYFDLQPAIGVEVKRVPEFKEKTSPQAYYDPPPLDGSRKGVFWINLRNVREIKKFGMRTLAYHEAIPGHHFQIAIARELADLPTVQKILPFTAYVEGWALYAERLAKEIGYQADPYDDLGRLQAEQFRAVRLVVDSGMHYQRWTREQAIAYMLDKTGMPETDVVAEIERYLVWPGQALAYKVGQLRILELRERARQREGERFDLRRFHHEVLSSGALPLGVLEARLAAQQ